MNFGQGFKGAAGGAMAGGAFGPYGAAIGGGIGLLAGLLGGDGSNDQLNKTIFQVQQQYDEARARDPYTAGAAAQAGGNDFEQRGRTLADVLQAQAQGKGPSLAMTQARQAADAAAGAQGGLAAGAVGRGVSPGAAYLQAANNAGVQQAAANQYGVQGALAERTAASRQLGDVLQGFGGQSNQRNMFNAQQNNQNALANLQALINQRQMTDAERAQLLQMQYEMQKGNMGPGFGDQILAGGGGVASMGLGAYGKAG